MKAKSFTLIEILLATMIFTLVVMTAAVSFALVRRSNDRTNDLRIVNECARQVEDFITTEVKSAKYGPRIIGLVLYDEEDEGLPPPVPNTIPYYLKASRPTTPTDPNPQNVFRGILLIKSQNQARAIFVCGDKYCYRDFSLSDAEMVDNTQLLVPVIPSDGIDATLIHSDSCTSLGGSPDNLRPFYINQVQDIGDPTNNTYEVIVEDSFCRLCSYNSSEGSGINATWRRLKRQSASNQIYSRVYVRVTNNLKQVK